MNTKCRLGLHDWETERFDIGYAFRECHRCGHCEKHVEGSLFWRNVYKYITLEYTRYIQAKDKQLSEEEPCPECGAATLSYSLRSGKEIFLRCINGHCWPTLKYKDWQPCRHLEGKLCHNSAAFKVRDGIPIQCLHEVLEPCYTPLIKETEG